VISDDVFQSFTEIIDELKKILAGKLLRHQTWKAGFSRDADQAADKFSGLNY